MLSSHDRVSMSGWRCGRREWGRGKEREASGAGGEGQWRGRAARVSGGAGGQGGSWRDGGGGRPRKYIGACGQRG